MEDTGNYLYNVIKGDLVDVKMWTKHVPVESAAIDQLRSITKLPFVFKHVAAMLVNVRPSWLIC